MRNDLLGSTALLNILAALAVAKHVVVSYPLPPLKAVTPGGPGISIDEYQTIVDFAKAHGYPVADDGIL
jgi:hypothetical protein